MGPKTIIRRLAADSRGALEITRLRLLLISSNPSLYAYGIPRPSADERRRHHPQWPRSPPQRTGIPAVMSGISATLTLRSARSIVVTDSAGNGSQSSPGTPVEQTTTRPSRARARRITP